MTRYPITHKEVVKAVYPKTLCERTTHSEFGDCWRVRDGEDVVAHGGDPRQAWFLARVVLADRQLRADLGMSAA